MTFSFENFDIWNRIAPIKSAVFRFLTDCLPFFLRLSLSLYSYSFYFPAPTWLFSSINKQYAMQRKANDCADHSTAHLLPDDFQFAVEEQAKNLRVGRKGRGGQSGESDLWMEETATIWVNTANENTWRGWEEREKRQNQEGRRSRSGKMSSRGENRKVFQWQPTRRSKNERKKEKANSEPANIEALCKRCVNIRAARWMRTVPE